MREIATDQKVPRKWQATGRSKSFSRKADAEKGDKLRHTPGTPACLRHQPSEGRGRFLLCLPRRIALYPAFLFGLMPVWSSAPVAQLDRALPSEGRGRGFESLRVHQFPLHEITMMLVVSSGPVAP